MSQPERKGTGQSAREHAGRGDAGGDSDAAGYNCQDWGRTFLAADGRCVYIDLNHVELALPDVPSAHGHEA